MAAWSVGLLCVALAVLIWLGRRFSPSIDPREPPYIPSRIPVIGHLLGVLVSGAAYYRKLHQRFPHLGLFSLRMPGGQMYIVSSAGWANALEKRDNRNISLELMILRVWGKMFGMNAQTEAIWGDNLFGDEGPRPNFMNENHDLTHKGLGAKGDLVVLKRDVLRHLSERINGDLARHVDQKLGLWSWIREHMAYASMAAFYGAENPILADAGLMQDFWTWEAEAPTLMMTPFPSVLARKPYLARQRWCRAWVDYVENNGYRNASQFIQDRAKLHLAFGLSKDQYGLAESGMPHALLVNMIPAAFWLISFVFQEQTLLFDVRAEIDKCVRREGGRGIVAVGLLQSSCPLFVSTFKEMLRVTAPLHTNRVVREDTLVTNSNTGQTYLFKKDSAVQYASTIIHSSKDVWGEDAEQFQPRRFMPTIEKGGSIDSKIADPAAPFRDSSGKVHSGSFRAFGGGHNLCPGRHLATAEILALAATFIAGFEIESEGGGRPIPPPFESANGFLFVATMKPEHDAVVRLRWRTGWQEVEWVLES